MIRNEITVSIIEEIEGYFRRGITAGDDVMHFAGCTLGTETVEEIRAIIADGSDDGIAELVFSPPGDFMLTLEPRIPVDGLTAEEEELVFRELMDRIDTVAVYLGKERFRLEFVMTDAIARGFLRRLRLKMLLPHALEIEHGSSKQHHYSLPRMLIRRSAYHATSERDEFLCRLIAALTARFGDNEKIIAECIVFLLDLFSEEPRGESIRGMITDRKRFWEEALARVAEYRELSRGYSMDYLMSQRLTPPALNVEEAERSIRSAERITALMSGDEYEPPPLRHVRLDVETADDESIAGVIRFLS